jgi:2-methylcitrate dehydratase PrpD
VSAPAALALGELVERVRSQPLPPAVADAARAHVLYDLACGLAADHDAVAPAAAVGLRAGGAEATVLGGARLGAEPAAFLNAALVHSRAQDDTHFASQCHPGAVVLPAALALAERDHRDGATLLRAVVAGYEVAAAVGEPLADDVVGRGFRAASLFGALGAAAAASVVLDLDGPRAAHAIALAASFAGGLTETWVAGSTEWLWEVGAAARAGMLAADLAAAGAVGSPRALEGRAGFARAVTGRDGWAPPADWALGERWRTLEVIYKPYPVCNIAQAPIELALRLRRGGAAAAEAVGAIRCHLNPADRDYPGTLNAGPFAGRAATLMSVPYCVAMALVRGSATLDDLRRVDDPALLRLVARTQVLADPALPPLGARLEVEAADGRVLADELVDSSPLFTAGWSEAVDAADRLRPEMHERAAGLDVLRAAVADLERLAHAGTVLNPAARVPGGR